MAIPLTPISTSFIDDPLGLKIIDNNNDNNNSNETKTKITITQERLNQLKKLVDDAVREHKIFTIKGGWNVLRREFHKRNWIEKIETTNKPTKPVITSGTTEEICSNLPSRQSWESSTAHIAKCERTIMSRLLQLYDVDFYWNSRKDHHDIHLRMNCHKLINRFSRSLFTSKEGLCLLLQQMYWHNEPDVASVNFPRCYVLGFPDHYNNFVEDFRLTACMSIIKYVVNKYEMTDKYEVQSPEGTVSYRSFQFAIDRLNEHLCFRKHLDIDVDLPKITEEDWEDFLIQFKDIVHNNKFFLESKEFNLMMLCAAGKEVLKKISLYWPQYELDGMRNIWIMKPGNKCRGRGIQLIKEVADVAKIMELKLKYVVQKYIERPLIIYNTKFDIRQWFLITSVQPLCIWMYRECYLRFSSQNFSLDNFHESLHLTNHAVQCKYKNNNTRHKALPDENMWDCHMFKDYLAKIGHESKWDQIIYPGMRENIIGSMLACQDTMDRRPNTFELYGADFILAEDFKPWLLEINSSPDLSSSTSVTARMCPQCLEDLVKVVVDRRKDPNCSTGLFDLIYKQNLPRAPAYLGMSLSVRGRRIFKRSKIKKDKENDNVRKINSNLKINMNQEFSSQKVNFQNQISLKMYNGPVIADLMEEIQKRFNDSDLDDDCGVEHASPIKFVAKKRDTRVQKAITSRSSNYTNESVASSPNRFLRQRKSGAFKNPHAPEIPLSKSSNVKNRVSFGPLSTIHNSASKEHVWTKTSSVSILKGKNILESGISNKLSCYNVNPEFSEKASPKLFRSAFGHRNSKERKNLLTIGYGLGLRHISRPNT